MAITDEADLRALYGEVHPRAAKKIIDRLDGHCLDFIAAPFILTNYAFAGRPHALWWIDAGHAVVACGAIGAVLGLGG